YIIAANERLCIASGDLNRKRGRELALLAEKGREEFGRFLVVPLLKRNPGEAILRKNADAVLVLTPRGLQRLLILLVSRGHIASVEVEVSLCVEKSGCERFTFLVTHDRLRGFGRTLRFVETTGLRERACQIDQELSSVLALLLIDAVQSFDRILHGADSCAITAAVGEDQSQLMRDQRSSAWVARFARKIESTHEHLDRLI